MSNLYRQFLSLIPRDALLIGTVLAHNDDGTSDVELPGAQAIRVRGQSVPVGQNAFVRGGEIIGEAPNLTLMTVEI